jgi:hypothetical protein
LVLEEMKGVALPAKRAPLVSGDCRPGKIGGSKAAPTGVTTTLWS